MPELPEVETTRRGIRRHIKNQSITKLLIRNGNLRWPVPKKLPVYLRQQTICDIGRRGKYLIFKFAHGSMLVHLGMSGSLRIVQASAECRKHDHIDWCLSNGKILRYHDPRRFGSVHWTTADPLQHVLLKDLGPEPLSRSFSGDYLFSKSRKRKVAVKNFIMNSHTVTGVGNIYANEALFLAGIHPLRAAGQIALSRYIELAEAIKKVLKDAISQGGTTLRDFVNESGNPGYFRQRLRVYERQGQACDQCDGNIQMRSIAQRASYYCRHCQR